MLKVAYNDSYVFDVPKGHKFPMEKYDLLPKQLLFEGTITEDDIFSPVKIDISQLRSTHNPDYLDQFLNLKLSPREQRVTGFIHNTSLVNRELMIVEGTRKAAELALTNKAAMNIAGGTHHAFSNRGEGFCMLNDQAIASNWLLENQLAKNILIIDLDVHQGNGTAEIFENNTNVFTFSMHGKNNYPLKKECSDLDVELEDGTKAKQYLYDLEKNLDSILREFTPDFVFYQCGVDILSCDKLGRLDVSIDGCKKRDELVFNLIRQLNVPVVCSMGGGYSPFMNRIINAHANTFRSLQSILF